MEVAQAALPSAAEVSPEVSQGTTQAKPDNVLFHCHVYDPAGAKPAQPVNFRKGAGTTFAVLAVIPSGTLVTLLSAAPQNGFLNVSFNGSNGWSSATYLTAVTSSSGGAVQTLNGHSSTWYEPAVGPVRQTRARISAIHSSSLVSPSQVIADRKERVIGDLSCPGQFP